MNLHGVPESQLPQPHPPLPAEREASTNRPTVPSRQQLNRSIFDRRRLIEQVPEVDDRLPLDWQPETRKFLCHIDVDIWIVDAHSTGKGIDREDDRRWREPDHRRDPRSTLVGEIEIKLGRRYLKESITEKLCGLKVFAELVLESAAASGTVAQ